MKIHPLISIITPTLNRADFIERTIKSVIRQKYTNFEHIIVDGVSTDTTFEILQKYKHLNVYSFKCSATEAQNFGIEKAKGDLICFLNSDDYLLPDSFLTILEYFYKHKDVSLFSGSFAVAANNKIIYKAPLYHDVLDLEVLSFGIPGMGATFFKKEVFEHYGKLRHDLTLANDRGYIAELILGGAKRVIVPKHILVYWKHQGSGTINDQGRLNSVIVNEHIKLSQELISRSKEEKMKKIFQSWLAFEKAKEILIDFKKKNYLEGGKNLKKFLGEHHLFIFLFYSLRFYVRRKILLKNESNVFDLDVIPLEKVNT